MSERYRSVGPPLIVLAVSAVALIAAGQAGNYGQQSYRGSENAYTTDDKSAVIEPPVVGLFPPNYRPEPAYQSYNTDQYDLVAQRWMAWLTGLIALFTGVGIILLWFTLKATQRTLMEANEANRAALKAADASDRSVNISEDVGQRQIRAYLGIEKAFVETFEIGKRVEARISLKNFGQSPATYSNSEGKIVFLPTAQQLTFLNLENFFLAQQKKRPTIMKLIPDPHSPDINVSDGIVLPLSRILPGTNRLPKLASELELTEELMSAFLAGQVRCYVLGRFTYTDVYDVRRQITFLGDIMNTAYRPTDSLSFNYEYEKTIRTKK